MEVKIVTKDPREGDLMKCGDCIVIVTDWRTGEPFFKGATLVGGCPNFRIMDCCKINFNRFLGMVVFDGRKPGSNCLGGFEYNTIEKYKDTL